MWALPDDRRIWTAYAALIALLTVLTFGSLGDLLLDTHEDEIFRDHELADGLGYFFQSAAEKEFNSPGRPATEIARYLGYLIWGNDPGAFHLYCAGVHALASLLLAVAARSLGATLGVSLLGGLLFLLNVGHFRGVHYISGLDYPLAQVGSVAAAICYARYARERRTLWLVACGVCLVLGTASHQAAVMVLPFLWYWSWAQGRDAAAALKPLVPLGLILLLEVYLLLQITDREGATTWVSLRQLATDSPIATIPAMGRVLLWLAGRLFTTAHWLPLTVYEQQGWEIYFGGLVFAGLGILVWRRMDLPGIWAAWISLSLLPFIMVSEEIHIHLVHGPSRHLYMASAGSSLLLAWGLQRVGGLLVGRCGAGGYLLYAAILLGLGATSYALLKKTEALSHYSIGRFYLLQGDYATGTAELERAIAVGGDIIPLEDAYYRLCVVKLGLGENIKADVQAARRARPESPRLGLIHHALVSVSGDPAARQQSADSVLAFHAALAEQERLDARAMVGAIYANIGLGADRAGQTARAVLAYGQALAFDESRTDLLFNLGSALYASGATAGAIRTYEAVLAREPDHGPARTNLGWALYADGRVDEAIEHYLVAVADSANGVALFNLGLAYLARGDWEAAVAAYARAVAEHGAAYGIEIGAVADLRARAAAEGADGSARALLAEYWSE